MTSLTQHFGDFDRDFVATHPLPLLEKIGVGARMHETLDKVASSRQMVAILGEKGIGKSYRLEHARRWFIEREAQRHDIDNRHLPAEIRVIRDLRHSSYDDVLGHILKSLDKRASLRENGRKLSPKDVKDRICSLLDKERVTVLVLDECEVVTLHTLQAFRDVMIASIERARTLMGCEPDESPMGTGLVIVGTPAADTTIRSLDEFGNRLMQVVKLSMVPIADAMEVMMSWLPAARALSETDLLIWQRTVRMKICCDRDTTMLHLRNVVLEYARRLDRARKLRGVTSWAGVPLDLVLLGAVAGDMCPPEPSAMTKRRARV